MVCIIIIQMRRTKEEAQKTREGIFRSSLKLFIEKGYDSTTINDITQKAGVTKGALYWHFKDKDAILGEIIEYYDRETVNNLPIVLGANASSLMKIKFLTYPHIPDFKSKKKLKNFFRLKVEISNYNRKRGTQPYALLFIKELTTLFEEAKASGDVNRDVEENVAALTVSLLITGTYIKYDIDEAFFKNVKDIASVMDGYFDSICTKKGKLETKNFKKEWEKLLPVLFFKL